MACCPTQRPHSSNLGRTQSAVLLNKPQVHKSVEWSMHRVALQYKESWGSTTPCRLRPTLCTRASRLSRRRVALSVWEGRDAWLPASLTARTSASGFTAPWILQLQLSSLPK